MFKKLLKAVLPALLVFSFANVNDAKVEEENKKKEQEEFPQENYLVEGKENATGIVQTETPDVVSKVIGDTIGEIYEYSDDDII